MTECPRWRLITAHYLTVATLPDGTEVEWEHKETNRANGRAIRKLYKVPMFVAADEPDFYNPDEDGVVVTHEVEGATPRRRDLVFIGDPTPDMEPLNPEAQAISDACRERWENPIDSLPANGGMNEAEQAFMAKMMQTFAGAMQPAAAVPKAQYDELAERLAKLEATLAGQVKSAEPTVARRV